MKLTVNRPSSSQVVHFLSDDFASSDEARKENEEQVIASWQKIEEHVHLNRILFVTF